MISISNDREQILKDLLALDEDEKITAYTTIGAIVNNKPVYAVYSSNGKLLAAGHPSYTTYTNTQLDFPSATTTIHQLETLIRYINQFSCM